MYTHPYYKHNRSNILLDEYLTAKLAETVGNVMLINAKDGLPGTNGYLPPEFSDSNYSDIYSLGVVRNYNV